MLDKGREFEEAIAPLKVEVAKSSSHVTLGK